MAKLKLQFTAWEEMAENLDKLGGDLRRTTEEALKKSHKVVTPKIEAAFIPHAHRFSGDTIKTLRKNPVIQWEGLVASVAIGFDIKAGGLPSVFIMYGTPRHDPDRKLYNAFYGGATKKQINEIQKEVFQKAIEDAMK